MDALVKMHVNFPNDGFLTFTQWLPDPDNDVLSTSQEGIELSAYFHPQFAFSGTGLDSVDISKQLNIWMHSFLLEAKLRDLPPDFLHFLMASPREQRSDRYSDMMTLHTSTGQKLFRMAVAFCNRLIECARYLFQQFHLESFPSEAAFMSQFFARAGAKIVVDGQEFRFMPMGRQVINVTVGDGRDYIRREDWLSIKQFLTRKSRPPLIGVIIANARQLERQGYRRSALVEGVTALEVALAGYCDHLKRDKVPDFISQRVDVSNLQSLVDTLGLRGSFAVALPLIFPEEVLSSELLGRCRKAIEVRNNIVHNGQRDLPTADLRSFLSAIAECAFVLGEAWDSTSTRFRSVPSVGLGGQKAK